MACLMSRTGREMQRYNSSGGRQVVGDSGTRAFSMAALSDKLAFCLVSACLVTVAPKLFQWCIPYRYKEDNDGNVSNELEVLVVSSQKGQALMFPKGGWELDESVEEAASRESLEEAGVTGIVQHELGQWSFISKRLGTYYEGHMFPLLVKEQLDLWPEKDLRRRIWMSINEAREVCQHWWMKEALDILVERLTLQKNRNI
ncbi:hypothetical protein JHK82_018891 [Glycine max]|nr:nudix hydrolase 18, mitochondrial isoform X1 [Glycine max]XP_028240700.1 nudix hydrolase 18, mitochondrial-like isoform X1 [Glycine soja]KAG4400946.1 hypothetical protein GLYMA_07G168600v4 [Glycine max]KAG5010263.1 hypothetical protein JHK87_018778 [Glycine soja]KAG5022989.1 hypothetical protein JHK85_019331 [Glycine max]KAG5143196.1 hypothetical protein JHK82_018891 [Glycine max]KAH1087215.1 hypothetical protein GYH30_018665 [Glycine max]|eukprot:XP_014633558.1 nudix hydrolase 18, mitochondrial isoform X1 [Glycine max]